MSNWELFQKGTHIGNQAISIYKAGIIALPESVWSSLKTEFVELLYNRQENKIGIRASSEESPNSYKLVERPNTKTRIISSASFISHYGLEHPKAKRYKAEMKGDMLVIDLGKHER